MPLIEAELDRQDPDLKMRAVGAAGFREGWPVIERRWDGGAGAAAAARPAARAAREYSFVETLRHLVFATDACSAGRSWASRQRTVRSACRTTRCPASAAWARDRDARPPVAEVLALRADRYAR